MNKMIRYIDLYWPVEACNLNCPYCYVHQHKDNQLGKRYVCSHTPEEIRTALSKKRLGGSCLLNICAGGETLLEESIIPIVSALLEEGHYVSLVTNGLLQNRIQSLLNLPAELRKHLFLKFSFHYGELCRLGMIDSFFETVQLCKTSGVSFTLELPAYDDFLPKSKEIIDLCVDKAGAPPHVAVLRDESKPGFSLLSGYSFEELNQKWSPFDSELFRVRANIMANRSKGFCYAGTWSFTAHLESGEIRQCHYERVIGNLYDGSPLPSLAVGNHCHSEYCYIGHAFLTLGTIPTLPNLPYYDEVRDRTGADWLNDEVRCFMHQKLYENNPAFTPEQCQKINENNQEYERSNYIPPSIFSMNTIVAMKNQEKQQNYSLLEAIHNAHILYGPTLPAELCWIEHVYTGTPLYQRQNETIPLKVTALGEKNVLADGDEIWIIGAIIDQIWYDACDIFRPTGLSRARMIGWRSWDNHDTSSVLTGQLPINNSATLIFEANKWRGICSIELPGQKIRVDTYSSHEDSILEIPLSQVNEV